jgi:hypothetical protein
MSRKPCRAAKAAAGVVLAAFGFVLSPLPLHRPDSQPHQPEAEGTYYVSPFMPSIVTGAPAPGHVPQFVYRRRLAVLPVIFRGRWGRP